MGMFLQLLSKVVEITGCSKMRLKETSEKGKNVSLKKYFQCKYSEIHLTVTLIVILE